MEFGKGHDTADTTDFWPCQLVTDLLRGNRLMDFDLRGAATASSRRIGSAAIGLPYVVRSTIGLLSDSYTLLFLSCASRRYCNNLERHLE